MFIVDACLVLRVGIAAAATLVGVCARPGAWGSMRSPVRRTGVVHRAVDLPGDRVPRGSSIVWTPKIESKSALRSRADAASR